MQYSDVCLCIAFQLIDSSNHFVSCKLITARLMVLQIDSGLFVTHSPARSAPCSARVVSSAMQMQSMYANHRWDPHLSLSGKAALFGFQSC